MIHSDSCMGVCGITQSPQPLSMWRQSCIISASSSCLWDVGGGGVGVGHHILQKAFVFRIVSWSEASWPALLTTQLNNRIDPLGHKRALISHSTDLPIWSILSRTSGPKSSKLVADLVLMKSGWLTTDQACLRKKGIHMPYCTGCLHR